MFGTYKKDDVKILLKDISGMVEPESLEIREKKIQFGVHYSEMLPIEYEPSEKYLQIFFDALKNFSKKTADAVGNVSEKIFADKGKNLVLVSLARAGTPAGILIKHFLEKKYGEKIFHYTISIIRGVGIDENALKFILARHPSEKIQFVDGWTGKGAIQNELKKSLKNFSGIDSDLAVLADPANILKKCGTHEDFLIASSCLNSTVSGLLSRTFLRKDVIGEKDFHGAIFYKNLLEKDLTYKFIDEIKKNFDFEKKFTEEKKFLRNGLEEVKKISAEFKIDDRNLIKPGIGETTRVLLRRMPEKILVYSLSDEKNLGQIYQLAEEKNISVEKYPLQNYKSCGLIKKIK